MSETIKTETVIKRSISLPSELHDALELEAKKNHRSFSAQIAFFCELSVAPNSAK